MAAAPVAMTGTADESAPATPLPKERIPESAGTPRS